MAILLPFLVLYAFLKDLKPVIQDQEARVLLLWIGLLLLGGTVFYSLTEGWTLLEALYFCVITLSTVGYGDLGPTTALTRVFTIFYVLIGISFFLAFVNLLAKKRLLIFAARGGKSADDIGGLLDEF